MKTGGDDRLDIYHTKQQTALLWSRFHCFHKLVQTCCVRVSLQGGLKCTRRRGRWEGGLVILQLTPPACTIQWTQTKLQLLSLFLMLGCSRLCYRLNQPIVKGKNEGIGGIFRRSRSVLGSGRRKGFGGCLKWEVMGKFNGLVLRCVGRHSVC